MKEILPPFSMHFSMWQLWDTKLQQQLVCGFLHPATSWGVTFTDQNRPKDKKSKINIWEKESLCVRKMKLERKDSTLIPKERSSSFSPAGILLPALLGYVFVGMGHSWVPTNHPWKSASSPKLLFSPKLYPVGLSQADLWTYGCIKESPSILNTSNCVSTILCR